MIFEVRDPSQVGAARRQISEYAHGIGFSEVDAGRVSIVTTELATNVVKHASNGRFIFRMLEEDNARGVEILCVDSGPGRSNIEHCMQDGYSTAGSPGNGLGAIRRLSDAFDIHSMPGRGTIVLSQLWPKGAKVKQKTEFVSGAVSEPVQGETLCGDGWVLKPGETGAVLLVVDGLGHGPQAHAAAQEALAAARSFYHAGAQSVLEGIHQSIRHTRGCAVSVAQIDLTQEKVTFCGAGNVAGTITRPNAAKRSLVSMNGTAGLLIRNVRQFQYPFTRDEILIMHSDGIDTRWELNTTPGLAQRHPSVIAAALFCGHRRERDDATVVVVKRRGEHAA